MGCKRDQQWPCCNWIYSLSANIREKSARKAWIGLDTILRFPFVGSGSVTLGVVPFEAVVGAAPLVVTPAVTPAAVLLEGLAAGIVVFPVGEEVVAASPRWMRPTTQNIKMAIVLVPNIFNFLMRVTALILIE